MDKWKKSLELFFSERGEAIKERPSLADLCYISGRDPRMWDSELYEDLIESIKQQLEIKESNSILEVGCAAGFLAMGLSEIVRLYKGVDLSKKVLKVASRLNIENASFKKADGSKLPFEDNSFDRVICHDVFTNLPDMEYASKMIKEMLRVAEKNGKVMIGSIADKATETEYIEHCASVNAQLDQEKGLLELPSTESSFWKRLKSRIPSPHGSVNPEIWCYYFPKGDFIKIGQTFNADTKIYDINSLNPYYGYRYNVVYTKLS